jgi:hypothetical protein
MYSRPRRSAAIKALEKIQNIVKEAEKYDDYGKEIEEIDVYIVTPSISEPSELVKTTPNTLFGLTVAPENLQYNAHQIYLNDFKAKYVEHIKKYLLLCEDSNMRYIAIPELINYLITNPALLIHHSTFATAVVDKMIDFENELPIAKKIGSYVITEDYRKELLSLIKILKKTSIMYSKLNNMSQKEFYDNIETIANDF